MRLVWFLFAALWPVLAWSQPIQPAQSGVRVLCQSGVPVALTGSVSETNLAVCQIPPLGPNDTVRISTLFSNNNDANSKTAKIRFSATSGDVAGGMSCLAAANTTQVSMNFISQMRNANSTGAQVCLNNGTIGGSGLAVQNGTIDTTVATYININGLLANSGDTLTLLSYSVELLRQN